MSINPREPILVEDNFFVRSMIGYTEHIKPIEQDIAGRECDCIRQIACSLIGGIFCFPCATTRLIGHYTGCLDPMNVQILCNSPIPGVEVFSGGINCCCAERGYEHNEYTVGQLGGSGFSRATLDKMNLVAMIMLMGGGVAVAAVTL